MSYNNACSYGLVRAGDCKFTQNAAGSLAHTHGVFYMQRTYVTLTLTGRIVSNRHQQQSWLVTVSDTDTDTD